MQDYRKLKVFEAARQLALGIYEASAQFPASEQFGLTAQMRSASVSILSNIAEGSGRESAAEFRRFLFMALGSSKELEVQLGLAADLGYLPETAHSALQTSITTLQRQLIALIRKLQTSNHTLQTTNRQLQTKKVM